MKCTDAGAESFDTCGRLPGARDAGAGAGTRSDEIVDAVRNRMGRVDWAYNELSLYYGEIPSQVE